MQIDELKTNLGEVVKDIFLITPNIYNDERGFFMESWNKRNFNKALGENIDFCQDNHSHSSKGVLRGLHYQLYPKAQGKLVRCLQGTIFDVAVDLRKSSKTFGQWLGVKLSEENNYQLWIPEGFAHGFLTLSKNADVSYKTTNYWSKEYERTISWNDRQLSIQWPIKEIDMKYPILAQKDKNAPSFAEIKNSLDIFQ